MDAGRTARQWWLGDQRGSGQAGSCADITFHDDNPVDGRILTLCSFDASPVRDFARALNRAADALEGKDAKHENRFFVHVYARGHYSGAYGFPTREAADADIRDRQARFAVLGCTYALSESAAPPVPAPGLTMEVVSQPWPPEGWKINNPDWPSGEGPHLVPED